MARRILVVSDSTGSTADHVLQAALAQFEANEVDVERRPQTRTMQGVREVVEEARQCGAMLVHTLASTELRRELYRQATEGRVPAVDLLGNLLSDLSAFLGAPAGGVPGGFHHFDEQYYRRMDALTFAVKHDDGRGLDDLARANIILVGISRTSKTPLSIFLAVRGYSVANVPMVLGIEPPSELHRVDQKKIVALRMDPLRLSQIRQQRLSAFPAGAKQMYTDIEHVAREMDYADQLFKREAWPVVDLTLKSLEEAAVEVVSLATDLPYHRPSEDLLP